MSEREAEAGFGFPHSASFDAGSRLSDELASGAKRVAVKLTVEDGQGNLKTLSRKLEVPRRGAR